MHFLFCNLPCLYLELFHISQLVFFAQINIQEERKPIIFLVLHGWKLYTEKVGE